MNTGDGKLPTVVECGRAETSSLSALANADVEGVRSKLLDTGAVLFHGFPALSVLQFAEFALALSGRQLIDYTAGASPRTKLGSGVYTSTEYPSSFSLPLHNELSYTSSWPEYLFFFCVTPAAEGGETPIGDSRSILGKIDPDVVERFQTKGIRYERVLEDAAASAYSWQAAFETADRATVEKYCGARDITFNWHNDGSLFLSEVRPAVATHPKTGDEVWFNQADGFHPSALGNEFYRKYLTESARERLRLNACFGDGSEIDVQDLEHIRGVIRNEIVLVKWHAGDVLVVDNMLACHGRMPYVGERKILLAMA
ncbi:MAG TPA: TauD/TfdA family dioxygenase [Pyrinomonadaceae bacterium]|nr:TauD/TfdA family dioxygenase [Pyrinomonadaceae bacterium]